MQKPARYTAAVRRRMADEDLHYQLGQVQLIRSSEQRGVSLQLASEGLQKAQPASRATIEEVPYYLHAHPANDCHWRA